MYVAFIIHGEIDSQEALEQKIKEQAGDIPISIPKYGEQYTLDDKIEVVQKYDNPTNKDIDKIELINKMQQLESELEEMKHSLKEDIRLSSSSDEDMVKLNNKVNELRKQIIQIMNK